MTTESIHYDHTERLRPEVSLCAFNREQTANDPILQEYFDEFMDLRQRYVEQEGWLPDQESDFDAYDADPQTRYIVAIDSEGQVSAGLRLTRNLDLQSNLSMSMWQGPLERQHVLAGADTVQLQLEQYLALAERGAIEIDEAFVDFCQKKLLLARNDQQIGESFAEAGPKLGELQTEARQGRVWDLTRLTTRGALNEYGNNLGERLRAHKDIVRMLGASMRVAGDDSVWVFTASQKVLEFLQYNQISTDILVHGRISPEDTSDAYLCVTTISSSFQTMTEQSPRSAQLVAAGRDSVSVVQ